MGVSSYFEFVVVTFGWICYTRFWDVLVDTGVALVPFLGIVLGNVMEAKKAGDDEGSAAVQSLKKIEVDVVVAVFVMMVAAVPLYTLDMGQMRYVRPSLECGVAGGAVVTAGDATAPYGPIRARLSGVEARIPLWWAAFHQLSKAATSAAVAGIPCSADVKMMQYRDRHRGDPGRERAAQRAGVRRPVPPPRARDLARGAARVGRGGVPDVPAGTRRVRARAPRRRVGSRRRDRGRARQGRDGLHGQRLAAGEHLPGAHVRQRRLGPRDRAQRRAGRDLRPRRVVAGVAASGGRSCAAS